jgi:hypothetical protein
MRRSGQFIWGSVLLLFLLTQHGVCATAMTTFTPDGDDPLGITAWAKGMPVERQPRVLALLAKACLSDGQDLAIALHSTLDVMPYETYYNCTGGDDVIESALKEGTYDALLVHGLTPDGLRPSLQQVIVERVEAGMGLVWLRQGRRDSGKSDNSPLGSILPLRITAGGMKGLITDPYRHTREHLLAQAVPAQGWKIATLNATPVAIRDEEVLVKSGDLPIVATRQVGKGRVVAAYWGMTWSLSQHGFHSELFTGQPAVSRFLTPPNTDEEYGMLATFVCWAAGRLPDQAPVDAAWQDGVLTLRRRAQHTQAVAVKVRVRDAWGNPVVERSYRLPDARATFALPLAVQGSLRVDLWSYDGSGGLIAWQTRRIDAPVGMEVTLALPEDLSRQQSSIPLTLTLDNQRDSKRTGRVLAEVADTWGRLLGRSQTGFTLPPQARQDVSIALPITLTPIETRLCNIKVCVYEGDTLVQTLRAQPCVKQPTEVREVLFGTTDGSDWIQMNRSSVYGKAFQENGLTLITTWDGSENELRINAERNTIPLVNQLEPYLGPVLNWWVDKPMAMKPSLCDPAYVQTMLSSHTATAKAFSRYSPHVYHIIDEPYIAPYGMDVDFSEHAVAAFRASLAKQYRTVDAMNVQLGTNYTDWAEVTPIPLADAVKQEQIPLWVVFRKFIGEQFCEYFGQHADLVKRYDPTATIGINMDNNGPFSGVDPYLFGKRMGYLSGYPTREMQEDLLLIRSCAPLFQSWVSYTDSALPEAKSSYAWETWYSLLQGASGVMYFIDRAATGEFNKWALFDNVQQPNEKGQAIARVVRQARQSVTGLLPHAAPVCDGIAIVYSPSSNLLRCALDKQHDSGQRFHDPAYANNEYGMRPNHRRSHCEHSFVELLTSMGYHIEYLPDEEISGETLQQYRTVFLASTVSLHPDAVRALEQFAQQGGILIADWLAGHANTSGNEDTAIREQCSRLFGIERRPLSEVVAPAPTQITAHLDNDRQLPLTMLGKEALILNGGKALGSHADGTPALVVHPVGNGKTVYLNGVPRVDGSSRAVLEHLLHDGGVSPSPFRAVAIDAELHSYSPWTFTRYALGSTRIYGLLRDYRTSDLPALATVQLDDGAWVYDLLTGESLGFRAEVNDHLSKAECAVYAALPYRVTGVTVTAPARVMAGKKLECSVQVITASQGEASRHAFLFTVTLPDGSTPEWGRRVVVGEHGSAQVSYPVAMNAPHARWQITVRDLNTGQTGSTCVEVQHASIR